VTTGSIPSRREPLEVDQAADEFTEVVRTGAYVLGEGSPCDPVVLAHEAAPIAQPRCHEARVAQHDAL